MNSVDIINTADYAEGINFAGKTAVIIDILRASTTIITLLEKGIKAVKPVGTLEEAYRYKEKNTNVLLIGERKGIKPEKFDYGNSPYLLAKETFNKKHAVITTTNGTRALFNTLSAEYIFIGALRNIKALTACILSLNRPAVIVCAGTDSHFSIEDFYAAGILVKSLIQNSPENNRPELTDISNLSLFTAEIEKDRLLNGKTCKHYRHLTEIGFKKDIEYALSINKSDIVPYYNKEKGTLNIYDN
ncbi:MAG: 2-phosphosulfolactate phosphatase [Spirochaetes bacterium]|nr:2-phosphosulfolactate phosphatase [Spirochaetota bacterium]